MVEVLVPVLKTAMYASSALLVGGLLFLVLVWPDGFHSRRQRVLLKRAWFAALVSALGVVLIHGPYVLATSMVEAADTGTISTIARTNYGMLGWTRVAVVLMLGVVLWKLLDRPANSPLQLTAIILGTAALVATMSLSGHALDKGPLVVAVDMVHLYAAFAWIGGLVVLMAVVLPTRRSEELAITVPAFSTMAFTSVVLLVFTGTYHGVLQVGSLEGLTGSGYGRLLCVKVIAFAVLLGLGGLSRRWVKSRYQATPPIGSADGRDIEFRQGLRRTVMIEVVVAVAVLGLTAMLVTTSPASHQAVGTVPPADVPAAVVIDVLQ